MRRPPWGGRPSTEGWRATETVAARTARTRTLSFDGGVCVHGRRCRGLVVRVRVRVDGGSWCRVAILYDGSVPLLAVDEDVKETRTHHGGLWGMEQARRARGLKTPGKFESEMSQFRAPTELCKLLYSSSASRSEVPTTANKTRLSARTRW